MKLRTLLLLLPTAFLVLIFTIVLLLADQSKRSGAMVEGLQAANEQTDRLAKLGGLCSDMTQRAIVWTLTRRTSERKQYQDVKQACVERLEGVGGSSGLKDKALALTSVLENIQSEHSDETKIATVGRLEREVRPLREDLLNGLAALSTKAEQDNTAALQRLVTQQRRAFLMVAVASALALVLGVLLTRLVLQRIVGAVQAGVDMAGRLAAGDLSELAIKPRQDEVGVLLHALDGARRAWITAISDIRESAAIVNASASEIADGAGNLRGSSQQAADSLQQTARTLSEIVEAVAQSATAADQANTLASSATNLAREGGSVVGSVVTTMGDIETASKKISEIIGVIDSIAFQTNILALNAAVEAARAGEQGRGFAVVASEVRALAKRSASAAGEIRQLITGTVERVNDGSQRAQGASQTMGGVCDVISRVDSAIREVSAAALQQGREIKSLATAIRGLEGLTQGNVGVVNRWTASADQLKRESERLDTLVLRFKLT